MSTDRPKKSSPESDATISITEQHRDQAAARHLLALNRKHASAVDQSADANQIDEIACIAMSFLEQRDLRGGGMHYKPASSRITSEKLLFFGLPMARRQKTRKLSCHEEESVG